MDPRVKPVGDEREGPLAPASVPLKMRYAVFPVAYLIVSPSPNFVRSGHRAKWHII